MSDESLPPDITVLGDDDTEFFRTVHGRTLNTLNPRYMLPVDADEIERSNIHHRLLQFVFGGRNYVGPVKEALQFGQRRRVLDLGTGGGFWAIDMADDFPRVDVIGVDLAPIQPKSVPPNCTFELCDLDQPNVPYPDSHFDFVHARSILTGVHDYSRLLREMARLLRPGGLLLLIEPDFIPRINGSVAPGGSDDFGLRGWLTFWETYRNCLKSQGIDPTVPQHLVDHLAATEAFENIVTRDYHVPVGFGPSDPHLLTIGQLQWMDYEYFLPAVKPFFLSAGLSEGNVERIIADAQHDLYYPGAAHISAQLHIVYASKCL